MILSLLQYIQWTKMKKPWKHINQTVFIHPLDSVLYLTICLWLTFKWVHKISYINSGRIRKQRQNMQHYSLCFQTKNIKHNSFTSVFEIRLSQNCNKILNMCCVCVCLFLLWVKCNLFLFILLYSFLLPIISITIHFQLIQLTLYDDWLFNYNIN